MFSGKLMDGDKVVLDRVELDLRRRPGTELALYDGVLHVPASVAAQLRLADWSNAGGFPSPPSYLLEVNELPSEMQRMTIFIDAIKADRDPGTSTVIFLTQIANEFG